MKTSKILILVLLVFSLSQMFAVEISDIFTTAKSSNTNFLVADLDLQSAKLNYEMSKIQADTKKELLNAELSYYSSLLSYRNNIKSFYSNVLNSIFSVTTSEIDLKIAEYNKRIAEIEYENTKNLYNKKWASDIELEEASLTVKEAEIDYENAQWDKEKALRDYEITVGKKWEDVDIKIYDYQNFVVSDQVWKDNSLNLKILELQHEIAKYNYETLSMSASEYDRITKKIELDKAELNLRDAQRNLLKDHKDSIQNLRSAYLNSLNSKDRLDIKIKDFEDSESNYKKGLISELEYLNAKLSLLNTKKSFQNTLKNYLNLLINYLVDTGRTPEEEFH